MPQHDRGRADLRKGLRRIRFFSWPRLVSPKHTFIDTIVDFGLRPTRFQCMYAILLLVLGVSRRYSTVSCNFGYKLLEETDASVEDIEWTVGAASCSGSDPELLEDEPPIYF